MDISNTCGWAISIEVEDEALPPFDDDIYGNLLEAMRPWSAAVSGRSPHAGYGATFSIDTYETDPLTVIAEGVAVFRRVAAEVGLPALPVTFCEAMTYQYQDRWLAT